MARFAFGFVLLAVSALAADEAADRTALAKLVEAFNAARVDQAAEPPAAIFASDLRPAERRALIAFDQALQNEAKATMSEVTHPVVRPGTIDFLSANTAVMQASSVQFGSLILMRSAPVLILARREGGRWRIVSIRFVTVV